MFSKVKHATNTLLKSRCFSSYSTRDTTAALVQEMLASGHKRGEDLFLSFT